MESAYATSKYFRDNADNTYGLMQAQPAEPRPQKLSFCYLLASAVFSQTGSWDH